MGDPEVLKFDDEESQGIPAMGDPEVLKFDDEEPQGIPPRDNGPTPADLADELEAARANVQRTLSVEERLRNLERVAGLKAYSEPDDEE